MTEFAEIDARLTNEQQAGRIDIRYRTAAGKHLIIELKRYSVSVLTSDIIRQIGKYPTALQNAFGAVPNEHRRSSAPGARSAPNRSRIGCRRGDRWRDGRAEAGEVDAVHDHIRSWVGELDGPVAVAYEAGPTGFGLYRSLTAAGIRCVVAAPSKLQRPCGDRVKTDAKDAVHLAATLPIAAHSDSCSARISTTIRTARSRSSAGYLFDVLPDMTPPLPRNGVSGLAGAVHLDSGCGRRTLAQRGQEQISGSQTKII